MNLKNTLILASNSPRRRQLFALGGWDFNVIVADVDETPLDGETPREYVLRLAQAKARAIQPRAGAEAVIIGSDTTVVDGDEILGKPVDEQDAIRMLRQLRGRTHQVYTGVAALRVSDGTLLADMSITDVPMRNYSDDEISAYVRTGDPMDKAGSYAIQHPDFNPVARVDGCWLNVMGLPLCHLRRALCAFDVDVPSEVPGTCDAFNQIKCDVYAQL